MKFEEGSKELEQIVAKLSSDDVSLEESIELFEKGVVVTKECLDILKEARGKITMIKENLDSVIETPFESQG